MAPLAPWPLLLAAFCAMLSSQPFAQAAPGPAQEVDALLKFYATLRQKKALTPTWKDGPNACGFKGVVCNDQDSVVIL